jgi:hypothetical protein
MADAKAVSEDFPPIALGNQPTSLLATGFEARCAPQAGSLGLNPRAPQRSLVAVDRAMKSPILPGF